MSRVYRALVTEEPIEGEFRRSIQEVNLADLPRRGPLIRVHYSGLNYKDALSASGHHGITRSYPHTPGIDASGIIEESDSDEFPPGTPVLVTGYDLGMNTNGGFGEYISVPVEWIVRLPEGLDLRSAMAYGTAGFTAALSVHRLARHGVRPGDGDLLVTGASGGVGAMAVGMLSRRGYRVVASTGKPQAHELLQTIGAQEMIGRKEAVGDPSRPLQSRRWSGAVDTVGGKTLSGVISSLDYEGAVAACGNVAGNGLTTTIFPFILRGAAVIGINSATTPGHLRSALWDQIATELRVPELESSAKTVTLEELDGEIEKILSGRQIGHAILEHRT